METATTKKKRSKEQFQEEFPQEEGPSVKLGKSRKSITNDPFVLGGDFTREDSLGLEQKFYIMADGRIESQELEENCKCGNSPKSKKHKKKKQEYVGDNIQGSNTQDDDSPKKKKHTYKHRSDLVTVENQDVITKIMTDENIYDGHKKKKKRKKLNVSEELEETLQYPVTEEKIRGLVEEEQRETHDRNNTGKTKIKYMVGESKDENQKVKKGKERSHSDELEEMLQYLVPEKEMESRVEEEQLEADNRNNIRTKKKKVRVDEAEDERQKIKKREERNDFKELEENLQGSVPEEEIGSQVEQQEVYDRNDVRKKKKKNKVDEPDDTNQKVRKRKKRNHSEELEEILQYSVPEKEMKCKVKEEEQEVHDEKYIREKKKKSKVDEAGDENQKMKKRKKRSLPGDCEEKLKNSVLEKEIESQAEEEEQKAHIENNIREKRKKDKVDETEDENQKVKKRKKRSHPEELAEILQYSAPEEETRAGLVEEKQQEQFHDGRIKMKDEDDEAKDANKKNKRKKRNDSEESEEILQCLIPEEEKGQAEKNLKEAHHGNNKRKKKKKDKIDEAEDQKMKKEVKRNASEEEEESLQLSFLDKEKENQVEGEQEAHHRDKKREKKKKGKVDETKDENQKVKKKKQERSEGRGEILQDSVLEEKEEEEQEVEVAEQENIEEQEKIEELEEQEETQASHNNRKTKKNDKIDEVEDSSEKVEEKQNGDEEIQQDTVAEKNADDSEGIVDNRASGDSSPPASSGEEDSKEYNRLLSSLISKQRKILGCIAEEIDDLDPDVEIGPSIIDEINRSINKHAKVSRKFVEAYEFQRVAKNRGKLRKAVDPNDVLPRKLAENMLSRDQARTLAKIKVIVPWEPAPLHLIETSLTSSLTVEQLKQISEQKLTVDRSGFSAKEDEIIMNNWANFCRLHDLENDPAVFLRLKHLNVKSMRPKHRLNFARSLARNLDNRLLFSVYGRFKRICLKEKLNTGRFSQAEDEVIIDYIQTNKAQVKFTQLGLILNRDFRAVKNRARLLTKPRSTHVFTDPELKNFVRELMKATEIHDVQELKNKEITSECWHKVCTILKLPIKTLKKTWQTVAYPRLFMHESSDLRALKENLIQSIQNFDPENWEDIDWEQLASEIDGFTPQLLRKIFKEIFDYHVPQPFKENLRNALLYLQKVVVAKHKLLRSGKRFTPLYI